jgi:hypothetical protein
VPGVPKTLLPLRKPQPTAKAPCVLFSNLPKAEGSSLQDFLNRSSAKRHSVSNYTDTLYIGLLTDALAPPKDSSLETPNPKQTEPQIEFPHPLISRP